MGVAVMIVAFLIARRAGYRSSERVSAGTALRTLLRAVPSLLLVVVVVGGIVAGVFTATEGAAVAVVYCLGLSLLYRSLDRAALRQIAVRTITSSGVVMLLIAASSAMAWVMAYSGIPAALTEALIGATDSSVLILALMVAILLVVGTFLDITPAILIFTPIFLPIAEETGMDPVHFGMVLILAMCIGTMTPPVGSVLFVATGVAGVSIEQVVPRLLPYFAVLVALLLLITYVPALSLGVPGMMGLLG